MKKAPFGDARGLADLVNRCCNEALGQHELLGSVEKPFLRGGMRLSQLFCSDQITSHKELIRRAAILASPFLLQLADAVELKHAKEQDKVRDTSYYPVADFIYCLVWFGSYSRRIIYQPVGMSRVWLGRQFYVGMTSRM